VTSRSDRLMEFLSTEGYRPTLRPDGDIVFKHEGGTFVIRFDPSDDEYLSIAYPNFWRLTTDAEVTRALRAANRATVRVKAVKILVFEEYRGVWASVEFFAESTSQFETTFSRTLTVLRAGVERFGEEMRASEPLEDERIALTREEVMRFKHGNY